MKYSLFVSCPRNIEYLLQDELESIGLEVTKVTPFGVYGDADLKTIYQICLYSFLANRVQCILLTSAVTSAASIVSVVKQFDWSSVFSSDCSFAVEFHGKSQYLRNTMYGAQLVKDGVVDYFSEHGDRPNVDKREPDVLLHAYLKKDELIVSLDMVGYSLHQRGYREAAGRAPIKENLAAALLKRAKWPELSQQGYALVDPFCGSGTFLMEGMMMASNFPPGLIRTDQAFVHWEGHDTALWLSLREEAKDQVTPCSNVIKGYDSDVEMVDIASQHMASLDLFSSIAIEKRAVEDFQSVAPLGLLISNPPYGERMDEVFNLVPVYEALGSALFMSCQGWKAAIFTSDTMLAKSIGLRVSKTYHFFNGALETDLYLYDLDETNQLKTDGYSGRSEQVMALVNRLKKNKKKLSQWLKQSQHTCYRLYDADLPDYAFVIDVYNDWVHVQEYAPPDEIPEHKAKKKIHELLRVLPEVLSISADHVVFKQRKRQKGREQYVSAEQKGQTIRVQEGEATFVVNLHDYLDTGLFIDHRSLRMFFGSRLPGKRLLNCFCYTGAFSVHAALNGFLTWNVDLSKTYLQWAKDNFRANQIDMSHHHFIQADCLAWLKDCRETFDVILLDPPSFSNSKRMQGVLDVQRDHEFLINDAMRCLDKGGRLYFSTNLRRFRLAKVIEEAFKVTDMTSQTLDVDVKKSRQSHQCFLIERII